MDDLRAVRGREGTVLAVEEEVVVVVVSTSLLLVSFSRVSLLTAEEAGEEAAKS
jgi:hypothetical protein